MSGVLDGKVAIVTGASRGIGKGLALGLAAHGAAVVCAARTLVEQPGATLPGSVQATAEAIEQQGGAALAVRCDIAHEDDIAALVEATVERFGRLDVVVNNAMAPTRGTFADTTGGQWDESMTTNVRSLFVMCKQAVPHLERDGGGSIVNISSGAAEHRSTPHLPPGYATYAVAKAALERFSTAIAPELAERNVAINALRPGAVKTELAEHELGPDHDWSGWGTPDAVVPAVLELAQQRGDGITGRVLDVSTFP